MMKYFKYEPALKRFVIDQIALPKLLDSSEILMKVRGFALNRADLLQKMGKYSPPKGTTEVLGLEAVGTIEHPNYDPDQLYGCIIPGGGYAEYCKVRTDHLIPFNSKIFSIAEMSAIPEVFLTALQLLDFANFNQNLEDDLKQKFIYIPAGASGVGTALIQISKQLYPNLSIFASVSTNEKRDFCLSLGADFVVNYKDEGYEKLESLIQEKTTNGLDAVLDCLGPAKGDFYLRTLKPEGLWVMYSLLAGTQQTDPMFMTKMFMRKIVLVNSLLRNRSNQYKAKLIDKFNKVCLPLLEQKKLLPVIYQTREISFDKKETEKLDHLHSLMETNKNIGKLVIQII